MAGGCGVSAIPPACLVALLELGLTYGTCRPCMKADLPALRVEVDKLTGSASAFAASWARPCSTAAPSHVSRGLQHQGETCSPAISDPIPSNAIPTWHAGLVPAASRFTDVLEADPCDLEDLLQTDGESPLENLVLPPVWPAGANSSAESQSGATGIAPKVDVIQCDTIDPLSMYLNWPA